MNPAKKTLSNSVDAEVIQKLLFTQHQQSNSQNNSTEKLTRGQRLADKLAAQVGSWGFLIGQSAVLAGWVGLNAIPGIPHWDESPFMMLNLVFSFASAYTAPVVLMSQNRQSDTDRRNAEIDHQVNCKAGQNIELLHEKLDDLHTQQLKQLSQLVKQQQQVLNELKIIVSTTQETKHVTVSVLPEYQVQINSKFLKQTADKQFFTLTNQM